MTYDVDRDEPEVCYCRCSACYHNQHFHCWQQCDVRSKPDSYDNQPAGEYTDELDRVLTEAIEAFGGKA